MLKDDTNLPLNEQGEIYKILTKQTEATQDIVIDEGSNSLRNHIQAVENMLYEAQNQPNN